jgi:CSLREA domain-containing protein
MQKRIIWKIVKKSVGVFIGVFLVLGSFQIPMPARAGTTLNVNTTVDELNSNGNCSLREAVRAANLDMPVDGCSAGDGADTILLPAGTYQLTIPGQGEEEAVTGDLDLLADVTITGAGESDTVIDAARLERVFDVIAPDAAVKIENLTVQGGRVPEALFLGGGAVLSRGSLTLDGVRIFDSQAVRGGGLSVTQSGNLIVQSSTIISNSSVIEGGGIYSAGPVRINDSSLVQNQSLRGGGVALDEDSTIQSTEFLNNSSITDGGGIYNDARLQFFDLGLETNTAQRGGGLFNARISFANTSTFHSNAAQEAGGGAYNEGLMVLANVTLSGNQATGGGLTQGGAVFNESDLTFRHVTAVENAADQGGAIFNESSGVVNLSFSILTDSSGGDCVGNGITNMFTSLGYNITNDVRTRCGLYANGDRDQTDPLLGPLQDNGGFSQTHVPQTGSPAIDAGGLNQPCVSITDQRGYVRPIDADQNGTTNCDIGAVEVLPANASVIRLQTVVFTADEGQTVQFVFQRLTGNDPVSVSYATRSGSATSGLDFTPTNGVMDWAANDTAPKTLSLTIIDDLYKENDEYFNFNLKNPTGGGVLISPGYQAVIHIPANDPDGLLAPGMLPLILK